MSDFTKLDKNDPEGDFKKKMDMLSQGNQTPESELEEELTDEIEESDVEKEQEESDELSEEEEFSETKEEEEEQPQTKKKSPVGTIIVLRKQVKALKDQLNQEKLKKIASPQQSAQQAVAKLVEQGLDENEARQQVHNEELEQRILVAEFKVDHAGLLTKYPEIKNNIAEIVKKSQSAGLSPEEYCFAKFEYGQPAQERRAREAMKGTLETQVENNSVSKATRTAETKTVVALTANERQKKRQYEEQFGAISGERFKELYEQHPW